MNEPHSEDNLIPERPRSLAERLLYHSLDDPRAQFESGLVMRGMRAPSVLNEARLYRAVRYIAGTLCVDWLVGRVVLSFSVWRMRITQPMTRADEVRVAHRSFWVVTCWTKRLGDRGVLLIDLEKASSTL